MTQTHRPQARCNTSPCD